MKSEQHLYTEKLPNGKVRYTLRYKDPLTGKPKRISCVKENRSRQSYNSAESELFARLQITLDPEPSDITLSKCAELYEMDRRRVVREQTLLRNMSTIRVINRWIGEDVKLNKLTLSVLKSILLTHCEKNYTYNEKIRRYKTFLRWAYNNELLQSDFFTRLNTLPDDRRTRIEDKYLETDELETLLTSIEQPVWFYVTKFAVLSGCRAGEIAALKDSSIHDDFIEIKETVNCVTGKTGATKTAGSEREIYMRPELKKLVSEIRHFEKTYKLQHGVPQSPYFICGSDGGPFSYAAFNKYLRELSERILHHRITTHALRHTAASLLIAKGVPLETVSRQLGHIDSKVTRNIYIHVTRELLNRDREVLEKACILG